jgi:sulfide:quinone oxidoreductase
MTAGAERSRVVVAGGGVAAIEAVLALRDLAEEKLELEMIAPGREFVYRPLAVAAPFGLGEWPRFDLGAITGELGVSFREDAVTEVDPEARTLRTAAGSEVAFDVLLVATGVEAEEAVPGAVTYRGPEDTAAIERLLAEIEDGAVREVVFAVPGGVAWPLPLYELALMTMQHIARLGIEGAKLTIVTPEEAPLAIFGRRASEAVDALLAERGIEVHTSTHPAEVREQLLEVVPHRGIHADRVVALPRFKGREIPGLPHDEGGFLPVDEHGRVEGLADVYAAGDATSFPIKQGGIASQQADVAAQSIAARFGAQVVPETFRPVLRGMLLTGDGARYMRSEVSGGQGDDAEWSDRMLWWPDGKVAGRYLTRFLAGRDPVPPEPPLRADAIPVEVELPAR